MKAKIEVKGSEAIIAAKPDDRLAISETIPTIKPDSRHFNTK